MKRLLLLSLLLLSGCSVKRHAINRLGNALAGSGTTFAADEDPELIRAAIPFSLKMVESLLAENPRHEGLLLAATRGFTQYAYAFVQEDADKLEDTDKVASTAMRLRAAKLYLRARNYGLLGLEVKHAGFGERLKANPKDAVKELKKSEVPMMYPETPRSEALIDRVIGLDEAHDEGTVHTFLITYEIARPNAKPDRIALAKEHFDAGMALGEGHQAGPLVAYAENVLVAQKDKTGFPTMLR